MRVAQKYSDPNLMKLAQELGGSQPMEGTAMSEKQSDIVERLSLSSDPEKLEAADDIERLRECVLHNLDDRHKAVAAERAAILELIEAQRADAHLYNADYALKTVAAAIRARGEQP